MSAITSRFGPSGGLGSDVGRREGWKEREGGGGRGVCDLLGEEAYVVTSFQ